MILFIVVTTIFINKSFYIKELIIFLGIPFIILSTISTFYISFYNSFQKMEYNSIYEILSKFLYVIFIFVVIYFNFRLIGVLIANVLSLLIACGFLVWFIRKFIRMNIKFNFKYIFLKIRVASYFAGISFFTLVYYNIDKLLISLMIGDYQLGLYVIGYTFLGLLVSLISILSFAFFPVLSSNKINLSKYKFVSELFLKYILIISVPIVFGGIYFANKIITLAFGARFLGGLIPFQIIMLFFFLVALNTYNTSVLVIKNQEKFYFKLVLIAAIFNVIVDLIIIPIYGIIGAAIVTVLSELIVFIGSYFKIKKIIPLNYWTQLIYPFVGSIFMIICLYFCENILFPNGWFQNKFDVVISVLMGAIIYGLFLLFTNTITIKELKEVIFRKI